MERSMKKVGMIYLVIVASLGFAEIETLAFQPAGRAVSEAKPSSAEIEKYVRARIELGESMREFFRKRGGPPQFGGGEGPSMDEMRKLEEEINSEAARVLEKHDLTIETYQERSPEVFSDKEGVGRFLEEHPDLKKRYEALPPSPSRGGRR
jgi:hypothetical protein